MGNSVGSTYTTNSRYQTSRLANQ